MHLEEAREKFVQSWGTLGSSWGINRTMAQIHSLLLVSHKPLCAEEVMSLLKISRGNANMNLRALIDWGLVRKEHKSGERKEYFEAELDVWEIFRRIVVERKRREIDPALETLEACKEETTGMKTAAGRAFHEQMKSLEEFVRFASTMSDRVASLQHGKAMKLAMKIFG